MLGLDKILWLLLEKAKGSILNNDFTIKIFFLNFDALIVKNKTPGFTLTNQDFTPPLPLPILMFSGFLDRGTLGKLISIYLGILFLIK